MIIMGFAISAAIIWLAVAVILAVIEAFTMGLTCIWFALGAAAAAICSMLGGGMPMQIGAFLIVSIATLVLTRPWAKKKFNRNIQSTNVDAMVGITGVVLETVGPDVPGRVKADNKDWSAKSVSGAFAPGEKVRVLEVKGVTLIVEKEEE